MQKLPKYDLNRKTGDQGVNSVARVATENLGWIFRETHNENDFGIDGYLDVVADDGSVTGQQFAVQIKFGESYTKEVNPMGFIYRGDGKHLNYYNNHPMPVLLLVGDPSKSDIHWEVFDIEKIVDSGGSWTLNIPKKNILQNDLEALLELLPEMQDPASELKEFWEMLGVVEDGGIAIASVHFDEVVQKDLTFLRNFFSRIMQRQKTTKAFQSKVEITFDGEFGEEVEIYEFEEIREYIKVLLEEIPEISFFLTKNNRFGLLFILPICLGYKAKISKNYSVGDKIDVEVDPSIFPDLIVALFNGVNSVAEFLSLSSDEVEKISREVWESSNMPIPMK